MTQTLYTRIHTISTHIKKYHGIADTRSSRAITGACLQDVPAGVQCAHLAAVGTNPTTRCDRYRTVRSPAHRLLYPTHSILPEDIRLRVRLQDKELAIFFLLWFLKTM